ncbi:MAG TPA: hypothetical protein VNP36_06560 [Burkholderiales bacterium]|nr:hypothetical protein [Burkholderiales bacterium]
MRAVVGLICVGVVLTALAQEQERRLEIDPNTKIEGGADVRGSGANAGASARPDSKIEDKTPVDERKQEVEKDKPISERKPQEREPEEGARPLRRGEVK